MSESSCGAEEEEEETGISRWGALSLKASEIKYVRIKYKQVIRSSIALATAN